MAAGTPASPPAPPRGPLLAAAAVPLIVLLTALVSGLPGAAPPAELAAAADRVEAGRAYRWLEALQGRYPGRVPESAAHAAAPGFIASSLILAGASAVRIEERPSAGAGMPPVRNVLAAIPGRDRERRVVLAAHHDTVPGAPGAIDDGGAVAALVEVARALAAGPPPACDVELAVFDQEEDGLLGAKAHLRDLPAGERARVRAAIAVELVGWRHDRLVVHTLPYGFAWDAAGIAPSWLPRALTGAGRRVGVPVAVGDPFVSPWYQATVRLIGVGTGSDAGAYLERGVPACMLAGSSLTGFYEGYHTARDDLPLVDPARLDDAARVLTVAALALAARPEAGARPVLGEPYLLLGPVRLGPGALAALGLSLLVPAILAAGRLPRGPARAVLAGLAGVVALQGCAGHVLGVLVGWPAAVVALASLALPAPPRAWALRLALLPLLLEVLIVAGAAASFGFRWRGGALETVLLALEVGALLTVGPLLTRAQATTQEMK